MKISSRTLLRSLTEDTKGSQVKQCKSMLLFIIFSIIGMTSNDHIETYGETYREFPLSPYIEQPVLKEMKLNKIPTLSN